MASDEPVAGDERKNHRDSRSHIILCLLPPIIVLIGSVFMTKASLEFPKGNPTTAYVDEDKIIKTFSDLRRTRKQDEAATQPGANVSADDQAATRAADSALKYIDDQKRLISNERERLRRKAADNKNESLYSGESQLLDKEQELLNKEQALVKARELDPFQINAGRMYWGVVSIIYACVCAATLVTGVYIIRRMFKDKQKCQVAAALIIIGLLVFVKFCHLN
ncbi:MAG TPA: hypothetical protein VNI02_22860, partial [Blastocatellia bacterium]|nr:hypothetical protein [Blastocatellia bacterium]